MRVDVALAEDDRTLRVDPRGKEHRGQVECPLVQVPGVVLDSDRVQVDDAADRVAEPLGRGVLAEPSAVVAEMLVAGGLNSGEDTHRQPIIPMAASIDA